MTVTQSLGLRSRPTRAGFILLLGLTFGFGVARGQVLYGGLTGFVTDSSAAPVPGVHVEARNMSTDVARQTTTDSRGNYLFSDIQAGTYRITLSAPGFATQVRDGVNVQINTTVRVDAELGVAARAEAITVSASAVTLQTDRADVNNQIESSQVGNLPISGQRNYQSLLALVPGVSTPHADNSVAQNPQQSLDFSVNGIFSQRQNTQLDGASNNYPWLPWHAAYIPPAEAIETVSIVTNSFEAGQGMAGGASINVSVKSGTNQLHGSLWWYHTNSDLKARNFFYVGNTLPKNILNQGGLAVGGPIIKNKLFFFGDWERTEQRETATALETIATNALRQGNFAGTGALIYDPTTGNTANGQGRTLFPNSLIPPNRISSAAMIMIGLLPQPNLSTFPNNYFASGDYTYTRDNIDLKINYNPLDRVTVFGRYSISPTSAFDPQALGPAGGDALFSVRQPGNAWGATQSATLGGTFTVTPRLIVDGNVAFTRQFLNCENVDIGTNYGLSLLKIPGTNGPDRIDGGYPQFSITGFEGLGNPQTANPFYFRDNQYVAAGNVTWTISAHTLRAGWETRRKQLNHDLTQTLGGGRGGFNFGGGITSLSGGTAPTLDNAWADFLLGMPDTIGKGVQTVEPSSVWEWEHAFYIQDRWQATRKLALTYGIRWELYPFGTRDHLGLDRYDPATNQLLVGGVGSVPENTGVNVGSGQWAPRFGFAYRVTNKWVIRGGYAISTDAEDFRNLIGNYPTVIFDTFTGASSLVPAGSLATGVPTIPTPVLGNGILPLPNATSVWTVPKNLKRGYIQSFNFTVQRELVAGLTAEAAYVGTRAINLLNTIDLDAAPPGGGAAGRALAPRTASILMLNGFQRATYDGLQTRLTRRFSKGYMVQASYVRSKAIDWTTGDNWLPALNQNKGTAEFDRPNNLQISGVAELPFGRGKHWASSGIGATILGGWQISPTVGVESGTPFGVSASATSLNAPGNVQTANQVLPNVKILGNVGPGTSYFDPNAFAPVTCVCFGTSGRDDLRGPSFFESDLSLTRIFAVKERIRIQFRADVFNITNHPAFFNPGSSGTIDAATSTNVSSATRSNGVITALNGYTSITSAQDNSRQVRFSLTVRF